jgi:NAD(P)-dependent dehydrogenase (short-subunit alcohol dehydrogenase family)
MFCNSLFTSTKAYSFKIRVNAVCPGLFPSAMTGDGRTLAPVLSDAVKICPVGRAGRPEEIAGPVLMMGSKAGSYMDNAVVVVDGGRLIVS